MNTPYFEELIEHLSKQSDKRALAQALESLLTPTELIEISKRLQIFKLLDEGIPQREIAKRLGVGIATVSRGSRARQANENEE